MKHFEITFSLRDAQRAQTIINDYRPFREQLSQASTNMWEDYYDEETFGEIQDEDYAGECLMDFLDEFKSWLDEYGLEYEVRVFNED